MQLNLNQYLIDFFYDDDVTHINARDLQNLLREYEAQVAKLKKANTVLRDANEHYKYELEQIKNQRIITLKV